MPKINDIIAGLKISALVSLLLGLATVFAYVLSLAFYTTFHVEEYLGVRQFFLAAFFACISLIVTQQTKNAIESYRNDVKVELEELSLTIQIIIIGGVGITLILLSIYDLLNNQITQSLIESLIGILVVVAAVQFWLAKTPKHEHYKMLNGSGAIILMYILFLGALVPFSGVVIYWLYPKIQQNWVSWITFFLPAVVGSLYFLRIPTSSRSKKLR